jgi:hypothetical protein
MKKNRALLTVLALALALGMTVVACPSDGGGDGSVITSKTATFGSDNIPIYAGKGVSVADAEAKKTDIDSGYALVSYDTKTTVQGKIKKIVIVSGDSANNSATKAKATGVIEIGEDCSAADIRGFLNSVVAPALKS